MQAALTDGVPSVRFRPLDVQSRHLVERIEVEPLGLLCPCLADVFIGGESLQDLEAAGENIGSDEVGEVTSKLVMGVVINRVQFGNRSSAPSPGGKVWQTYSLNPDGQDYGFQTGRGLVTLDGRLLEGAVHAFDLPIGLWMPRLGQAMIDDVPGAGELEGMGAEALAALQRQPDSAAAEHGLPGVVKWVPLSVRTVWTL
jgi:hypothetical protein